MKPIFTITEYFKNGKPKKRKPVHGTAYTELEIKEIQRQLGTKDVIIPISRHTDQKKK
jgi:hypothetical protein